MASHTRMAGLLFASVLLYARAVAANQVVGVAAYDENVAAQYVWVAQVTGFTPDKIKNWSCGLACDNVKDVHSARVTRHGFPLLTLGAVAQYGQDECLLTFRGTKKLLNYLVDDFNFVWAAPYTSCPKCRVHKGFYDSWLSLKAQTLQDLTALGCDKKPIRVTGHSLGASMAVIASFELVDNYTLKHIYTLGQPRTGNAMWADAFQQKMANVPYFRITDYMDAVPHLPPQGFIYAEENYDHRFGGYMHPGPEIFYNATRRGSYRACAGGEDPTCSDQYDVAECLLHTCDHCSYLGMNPCDQNDPKPQCIQPKATPMGTNGQRLIV